MIRRNFNCTERELYALCKSGWETCKRYLVEMNAFSPLYTEEFVEKRQEDIVNTMRAYDSVQRRAHQKALRHELSLLSKDALNTWRKLRHFLEHAPGLGLLSANLLEIGSNHYTKAYRQQWEYLLKMLEAGQTYITAHRAELLENQNMPEGFVEEYSKIHEAYSKQYNAYLTFHLEGKVLTDTHVGVLNGLYDELNRMFAAGREVFREDRSKIALFKISHGLAAINGSGWAGINGKVFDENGKQRLIENLEIRLPETDDLITQESDGSFVLNHLAAGKMSLVITAPGYLTQEIEMTVKTDTYSTVEVKMEKDFSASPEAEDEAA